VQELWGYRGFHQKFQRKVWKARECFLRSEFQQPSSYGEKHGPVGAKLRQEWRPQELELQEMCLAHQRRCFHVESGL
jgi:hypothetical protein